MALRHPVLVLAVAAALLLSPSLVLGTLISHSSPQNLTWASQFSEQFRAGVLYPRWMADSFDGLGSPAFYFYPPVPFWIDALVSVTTFNLLSVPYRLAATTALLLFVSGLTMRAWLQQATASGTAVLVGAVAYMAAPYHLLDHYTRGAFAEFTAYALLPLVMLAIRQTVEDRRWGLPLLAGSYAALLASHLPTALLCSVTVIPAYVLFSTRSPARLLRCAAGGVLGLGLAAAYLVPALELQEWISSDQLWAPFYRPENWFVLVPNRWGDPETMRTITSIALALAVLALGLCVALLQMPVADARRKELGFWIALSLACLVLVVGLVPWFWDLPLIGKVQFPWRLMMVVEFAAITALCLVPFSRLRRVVVYIFAAAAVALVPAAVSVASDAAARIDFVRHGGALTSTTSRNTSPGVQARRSALRRSWAGGAQRRAGDLVHASCPDMPRRQRALWGDAPHGRKRGADHHRVAALLLPGLAGRCGRTAGADRFASPCVARRASRPDRGEAGSRQSVLRTLGLDDFRLVAAAVACHDADQRPQ